MALARLRLLLAVCLAIALTVGLAMLQTSSRMVFMGVPFLSTGSSAPKTTTPPSPPIKAGPATAQDAKARGGKYFIEAGGSYELGHYDVRFFKTVLDGARREEVLRDLIKSYLQTASDFQLETWLAHGTLMGWWWGQRIMPWDSDIDVQMSIDTMGHLARELNHTKHTHTFDRGDGSKAEKSYLLDVNPNYVYSLGDRLNMIDARWIDLDTGMFVDITALAHRYKDRPAIWGCKNWHRYDEDDIWPLQDSDFEGVKAQVPKQVVKVLKDEYGAASTDNEHFKG